MPMVRGLRTLNAIETGSYTGACLDTLLTDGGRYSDFSTILTMPGQTQVMTQSFTGMCAITNSCNAMTALYSYPIAVCQAFNNLPSICNIFLNTCSLNFLGNGSAASTCALNYIPSATCAMNWLGSCVPALCGITTNGSTGLIKGLSQSKSFMTCLYSTSSSVFWCCCWTKNWPNYSCSLSYIGPTIIMNNCYINFPCSATSFTQYVLSIGVSSDGGNNFSTTGINLPAIYCCSISSACNYSWICFNACSPINIGPYTLFFYDNICCYGVSGNTPCTYSTRIMLPICLNSSGIPVAASAICWYCNSSGYNVYGQYNCRCSNFVCTPDSVYGIGSSYFNSSAYTQNYAIAANYNTSNKTLSVLCSNCMASGYIGSCSGFDGPISAAPIGPNVWNRAIYWPNRLGTCIGISSIFGIINPCNINGCVCCVCYNNSATCGVQCAFCGGCGYCGTGATYIPGTCYHIAVTSSPVILYTCDGGCTFGSWFCCLPLICNACTSVFANCNGVVMAISRSCVCQISVSTTCGSTWTTQNLPMCGLWGSYGIPTSYNIGVNNAQFWMFDCVSGCLITSLDACTWCINTICGASPVSGVTCFYNWKCPNSPEFGIINCGGKSFCNW